MEISTDGGFTWSTLTKGTNGGYLSTWTLSRLDLSAYVGKQIKIRFRLLASSSSEGDGWFLDTVSIGEFDVTDGDGIPAELDNCTVIPIWCQRDSDGYGNYCDGDLNNDGSTNTLDLNLYKRAHRTSPGDPDYNTDADFNGDDVINTLDLYIYKGLHRLPPGPSCCGSFY